MKIKKRLVKQSEICVNKKGDLLNKTNSLRQMKSTKMRNANFIESEILQNAKIICTTTKLTKASLPRYKHIKEVKDMSVI